MNRSILLDAMIAAGSNPTVTFLKESILNRRLSKSESLHAISSLPLYVRTPTAELLNELFVKKKYHESFFFLQMNLIVGRDVIHNSDLLYIS